MKKIFQVLLPSVIILALAGLGAYANYTATQGSGLTFQSFDNAGVKAPAFATVDSTGVDATDTTKHASKIGMSSGAVSSGAYASGSIASGAVASGAFASGALASGSVASGAMVDLGSQADSACATDNGSCSAIALIKRTNQNVTTLNTTAGSAVPAGTNTIGTVGQLPYPVGATPITASATGTTGATTATLAGTSGKTTYICGYSIRANATVAATVTNTITGVITATLSSIMWVAPLASGIGVDEQIFSPCIPASGTNQAIAIVSGAPGSGGAVSSRGWGYQL